MSLKRIIYSSFGLSGFGLILGLIIILFGFIPNVSKIVERNTSNNYASTSATIIRIDVYNKIHNVFVEYSLPSGIKHTTKLDTYVEGMKRGETITIFYNINDLNDITLSGNQFWQAILFGGIGAILMFISIIFIKKRFNKA